MDAIKQIISIFHYSLAYLPGNRVHEEHLQYVEKAHQKQLVGSELGAENRHFPLFRVLPCERLEDRRDKQVEGVVGELLRDPAEHLGHCQREQLLVLDKLL